MVPLPNFADQFLFNFTPSVNRAKLDSCSHRQIFLSSIVGVVFDTVVVFVRDIAVICVVV